MTRLQPTIHALPVGARGDHRASLLCSCHPVQATELLGGALGYLIVVHRSVEPVPVLRRIHPADEPEPAA